MAALIRGRSGESDRIRAGFRARGYPTTAAELDAWYRPVPAASNAAPLVVEAVGQLRPLAGRKSPYVDARADPLRRGEPWPADQRESLAALVRTNAEALGLLRAALERPESRYAVNLNQGFNAPLPHVDGVRLAARHLRAAAMAAVLAGDLDAAERRIEEQLKLAGTLAPEPLVISQLVRMAILQIAVQTLQDALSQGRFPADPLRRMAAAFAASVPRGAMERGLIGEMCLGGDFFRTPASQSGLVGGGAPSAVFLGAYGLLGLRAADEVYFLVTMRDMIEASPLEGPVRLGRMDEIEARLARDRARRWPVHLLSGMLLPAFTKFADKAASAEAMVVAAQVACALEGYRVARAGTLPERLESLVPEWLAAVPADPFDGQPLRYLRQGAGYTVYSVGEDRKDSGGRERPRGGKPGPPESTDLTFTVERRGP
ncbi:MAG: hypothetical protein ACKOET_19525 [Verrucomicrobiota bacterium]